MNPGPNFWEELFKQYQKPEPDPIGKLSQWWEWRNTPASEGGGQQYWEPYFPGFGVTNIKGASFPSFFDKAIDSFRNSGDAGWKSRSTLVRLSPQDFLNMAEFLPYSGDPTKAARVASIVKEGKDFELPELLFTLDRTGKNAFVTGHEGRHRAMEMLRQGNNDYPVRFTSQPGFESGATIRWGETPARQGFSWPEWLYGEGLNKDKRIPFPRSLFDYF